MAKPSVWPKPVRSPTHQHETAEFNFDKYSFS